MRPEVVLTRLAGAKACRPVGELARPVSRVGQFHRSCTVPVMLTGAVDQPRPMESQDARSAVVIARTRGDQHGLIGRGDGPPGVALASTSSGRVGQFTRSVQRLDGRRHALLTSRGCGGASC